MTTGVAGARVLGAVVLAAGLAACGTGDDAPSNLQGYAPEEILERGNYELEVQDNPDTALRMFTELERLHPYSEWAQEALIRQAYANHRQEEYDDARAAAQRYVELFPTGPDADYATYLIALSYYDQIEAVGLDQGLTTDALRALQDVFERYPDSEYARTAEMKFDLAFDHLAAKEMEVGRYYLRRGHYNASTNRFRTVVENFETSTHTPEALHRLVEAYVALGLTDEAQTAAAILGHNFRGSEFYDDSYRLLTGQGLSDEASGDGWLRDIYRQTVRGDWL